MRAPFSGELLVVFFISLRKKADKRRSSRVRRPKFILALSLSGPMALGELLTFLETLR